MMLPIIIIGVVAGRLVRSISDEKQRLAMLRGIRLSTQHDFKSPWSRGLANSLHISIPESSSGKTEKTVEKAHQNELLDTYTYNQAVTDALEKGKQS